MASRPETAFGVFVLMVGVGSWQIVAQAQPPAERPRVELTLIATPALSEAARASLMSEAAAIWRANDIAIEWLHGANVRSGSPHRLRVLVVDRRPTGPNEDDRFVVGELIRPPQGQALAMMSIENAQRLLTSVRGRAGYDLIAVDDRRLGIVLGRALAHEIGHYLLETHTHARHGLMRPQFNALEFTDRRDQTFALDRTASEWLKSRLYLSGTNSSAAQHTTFAYAQ